MMNTPVVSVILNTYKRTTYLDEAIQSILNQTFSDFELIVTDDAPSEATRQICAKYAADGRLRYRRNEQTLGAPLNVAAALHEAQGCYVTIISDDDAAEPFMLEKLVPVLEQNPQCVVCFADHWIMGPSGDLLPDASERNHLYSGRKDLAPGLILNSFHIALRGTVPLVMGAIFRRNAYCEGWMSKDVEGSYDYWLSLCLARGGMLFYYLNERVFRYRVHGSSESARQNSEKAQCQVYIFESLLKQNISSEERQFVEMTLAYFLFVLGRDRLFFDKANEARKAFLKAARHGNRVKGCFGVAATFLPQWLWRTILTIWRRLKGIRAGIPTAHVFN